MVSDIKLTRSRRLAGTLLAAMIALAIAHGLYPAWPLWPAGIASWAAGALLVRRVPRGQKIQLAVLVIAGVAALAGAVAMNAQPVWVHLLDANALLLTMIASVSFLRLVAMNPVAGPVAPLGAQAYRRTMLGVALFGSFINISAPILIADQLSAKCQALPKLDRFTSQSITRVFSGCSAWSPFFGGMAVVLTYVPRVNLLQAMATCLPFAVFGFLLVLFEARWRYPVQLERFVGYPITFASLWVPALLVVLVAVGSALIPGISILLIISVASILVCMVVLLMRHGLLRGAKQLGSHIVDGLPAMVGELLLFTCAGVLAVGLSAMVSAGWIDLPINQFDALWANAVLATIVLVSAIGLHPVISIAALTPLILPADPDSLLLATTYLLGWSLGTCASPLSGTHIIFQGRYAIPSLKGAVWNWPFALVMCCVGFGLQHWVAFVRSL